MRIIALLLGLLLIAPNFAFAQVDVPPPPMPTALPGNQLPPALTGPQNADEEGMETLTQGPLHDAFATPSEADPQPSPIVTEKPPADVPEQPPEYKPDGNFIWLPGYFEWDDDRRGFIWITGVWRQPPPGKRWMPSYWEEVAGGWQRGKGFWIDDAVGNGQLANSFFN